MPVLYIVNQIFYGLNVYQKIPLVLSAIKGNIQLMVSIKGEW